MKIIKKYEETMTKYYRQINTPYGYDYYNSKFEECETKITIIKKFELLTSLFFAISVITRPMFDTINSSGSSEIYCENCSTTFIESNMSLFDVYGAYINLCENCSYEFHFKMLDLIKSFKKQI